MRTNPGQPTLGNGVGSATMQSLTQTQGKGAENQGPHGEGDILLKEEGQVQEK